MNEVIINGRRALVPDSFGFATIHSLSFPDNLEAIPKITYTHDGIGYPRELLQCETLHNIKQYKNLIFHSTMSTPVYE